jgi:hypothetical protein
MSATLMLGAKNRLMLSKARADPGELVRDSYGEKSYLSLYTYDLLDWALAKRWI